MTTIFKKFAIGTTALALMTTVFATGALADGTVNTTITGDLLKHETNGVILADGPFKLTGKDQSFIIANLDTMTVTDPTGTGAGWNVKMSADLFVTTDATVPVDKQTLPADVLSISGGSIETATGANGSSPATDIFIDNGKVITTSLQPIITAAINEGSGTYDITGIKFNLKALPKDIRAAAYSTTVTTSITNGVN